MAIMSATSPFLIVKTGTAPVAIRERYGDFDDWFCRGLGERRFAYDVLAVDQGHALPDPARTDDYTGVLITGSPAMVSNREDWSERTAAWLAAVHDRRRPILGVCYGHQLLAHALGGRVGPNPFGRRMGTHPLCVTGGETPLLLHAADGMSAHSTHAEAVIEPPPGAHVLATAEGDPHHVLHFGNLSWGVQFHPEFDADIMRAYIQERRDVLQAEGFDSTRLCNQVTDVQLGTDLLGRFANLCDGDEGKYHAVGT